MVRVSILVVFHNKDTHRRQGFWDEALTTKMKIGFLIDLFKDIKLLQPPFLFIVGIQPDLLVELLDEERFLVKGDMA